MTMDETPQSAAMHRCHPTGHVGFRTPGNTWNQHRVPFMAIDPSESADVILDTLRFKWKLKLPKLLICILGGEDSDMPGEEEICKGLVETVLSTDVWLFTSGLQCGLIKRIGEVLAEHATDRATIQNRDIVAVGVTPLGILDQKDFTQQLVDAQGPPVVHLDYSTRRESSSKLEPRHTNFILMGSEEQGRGVEASVRNKLIKKIATMKLEGSDDSNATIPVVYLLFGGDATVFDTLKDADEIPIIYFPETGGAAEVLDELRHLKENRSNNYDTDASDCVQQKFGSDTHKTQCIKRQIEDVVQNGHHIIASELHETKGFNHTLLQSLMHALRDNNEQMIMRLAVVWDQIDLAKSAFSRTNKIWQVDEQGCNKFVEKLLDLSLARNQPDFVKFFIEIGQIDMHRFLSFRQMKSIYKAVKDDTVLKKLLERYSKGRDKGELCLGDIGCLLKELICDGYNTSYLSCTTHYKAKSEVDDSFKDPYKELFLWAVLQDHVEMALLFWELGKPSVGGALVAAKLLGALSKYQEVSNAKKAAVMCQHSQKFQQMAIDILDMCYEEDRHQTADLVVCVMPEWGDATCLEIASAATSKRFISHAAVQNLLSDLWMGRLNVMTHELQIGLCIICPLLSKWLITFKDVQEDSVKQEKNPESDNSSVTMEKKREMERKKKGADREERKGGREPQETTSPDQQRCNPPTWLHMMIMFLDAPVVTFCYDVISQTVFLMLFTYIILTNFHLEVSTYELVLMAWVFTLFAEEVRQLLAVRRRLLWHRFETWLWGYWNIVDLICLVLFAVGVALRFHSDSLEAARIVLALDLMMFYLRILHICSASKHLGPKLIMITNMLVDLISFTVILAVFLVAYGVACQAILYPNSTNPETIVTGVLYRSYFQMYGELFLGDPGEDCTTNRTQIAEGMHPCPQSSWFALVSLALYLFISNILLLNLLIAMLNYTFTAIQENTDVHWKFQRYQLIREYYWCPTIVPPFVLVAHVYQLVRYICDQVGCGCKLYRSPDLSRQHMRSKEMAALEKVKCQDYLAKKAAASHDAVIMKVEQLEKKLEGVFNMVLDLSMNSSRENMSTDQGNQDPGFPRSPRSPGKLNSQQAMYETESPIGSQGRSCEPSTSTPKKDHNIKWFLPCNLEMEVQV